MSLYEPFSELRSIYESSDKYPHTVRVTIKLKDMIDGRILEKAVNLAMNRFPYLKMRLRYIDERVFLEDNDAPLPVLNTKERVILGSEQTNYHLISFAWWKNKLHIDVHHSYVDGAGMANMMKALLYYYCSLYYEIELNSDDITLADSPVPEAEWEDPYNRELPKEDGLLVEKWSGKAHQIGDTTAVEFTDKYTVYNVRIPEKEFMRFNISKDGSPGTIVALFLSRAIDTVDNPVNPVVIAMCVNQRAALKAFKSHNSLVGDVRLVYGDEMRKRPFMDQATCFRGMVTLQSNPDMVLNEVRIIQEEIKRIERLETIEERRSYCYEKMMERSKRITATLSYVGKNNMGDAERYIQEYDVMPAAALPSVETPVTIEISVVNGFFFVSFIQRFKEESYFNEFVRQLRGNGFDYDVLYRGSAKVPGICLAK